MNKPSIAPRLSVLSLCLLLNACTGNPPAVDSGIAAPAAWQYAERDAAQVTNQRWWTQFGSPQLNRLIDQARRDSYDVGAAMARVRQAQASAVIAGAPLLPEVNFNLSASRQKLLRGSGNSTLDATETDNTVDSFGANLTASYEVDFWGGRAASRDSAVQTLRASEFDQATVELTLLSNVADRYAQTLAARQQRQIAELNLANARRVCTALSREAARPPQKSTS